MPLPPNTSRWNANEYARNEKERMRQELITFIDMQIMRTYIDGCSSCAILIDNAFRAIMLPVFDSCKSAIIRAYIEAGWQDAHFSLDDYFIVFHLQCEH